MGRSSFFDFLEELEADEALERAHLDEDRRLAHAKLIGRLGEAAGLYYRVKAP